MYGTRPAIFLLLVLHMSYTIGFYCRPPTRDVNYHATSKRSFFLSTPRSHLKQYASVPQEIGKSSVAVQNTIPIITVACLVALILQNSGLTILMRISRLIKSSSEMYNPASAVVVCEFMKIVMTFVGLYAAERYSEYKFRRPKVPMRRIVKGVLEEANQDWKDLARVAIPSFLYVIQNNLQYIAISNLPAEVYQIFYQLKILTTAFFSAG